MFGHVQTTFNRSEVETLCEKLTAAAVALEMLAEDDKILFHPGSTTNGHAPALSVFNANAEGHRKVVRVDWLPDFKIGDSRNTVGRILSPLVVGMTAAADFLNP